MHATAGSEARSLFQRHWDATPEDEVRTLAHRIVRAIEERDGPLTPARRARFLLATRQLLILLAKSTVEKAASPPAPLRNAAPHLGAGPLVVPCGVRQQYQLLGECSPRERTALSRMFEVWA